MYIKQTKINGCVYDVLVATIVDNEDIRSIEERYSLCHNVQIELSSLQYLDRFKELQTLIITGGLATKNGMEILYSQKSIQILILDYEETDSDQEGIELSNFPKLKYVKSRSNLNIHNLEQRMCLNKGVTIDVMNHYQNGRIAKGYYSCNHDILRSPRSVFFSTEAKSPASTAIINILKPLEERLNSIEPSAISNQLDHIGIIPICLPKEMLIEGFGKQRKYVSTKRRIADIRLRIPYESFMLSGFEERVAMCHKNIIAAAKVIAERDASFDLHRFVSLIEGDEQDGGRYSVLTEPTGADSET